MRMSGIGASVCSSSDTSESERSSGTSEEGDESADWRSSYEELEGSSKERRSGKYVCKVCDVVVTKPVLLRQHMASHSEERPFVCPMKSCEKSYKRQDHLNRHLLVHQGKLFLCPVEGCKLSFTISSNLQRHLGLHKKWGRNPLQGSEGKVHATLCPEAGCGKVFRYPSLLRTHIENVHGAGAMPVDYATLVCMEPGCGESFQDLTQLEAHKKTSHCYVACEVCGLSMLKNKLKRHNSLHEGNAPCIQCPYPGCLHSYTTQSNLATHIRAVHKELKPYACSYGNCGKRFAYKAVRDNHEKTSVHLKPSEGDFELEDLEFRMKPRGGKKRIVLHSIDDLLVKL